MEEINWRVMGPHYKRIFVIPVGNDKKWWQFWKKDKNKEALENIKNLMETKCDGDFFIPANSEQTEN